MLPEGKDYGLERDTPALNPSRSPMRAHVDLEQQSPQYTEKGSAYAASPDDSIRFRRPTRSNTAKTYNPARKGHEWHPGQEPGIDPSATSPHSFSHTPELHEQCEITVVDFSEDEIRLQHLDNHTLPNLVNEDRPDWASCR